MTPVKRTWAMIATKLSPERRSRFWSLVERRGPEECWEWRGRRGAGGYGVFGVRGIYGPVTAHRIAFGLECGRIPDGMNVLHSCDNPPCCNPAHLHAGTHQENMRAARARGRYQLKTHCKHGHPLSGQNVRLYQQPNGHIWRQCLRCAHNAAELKREQTTKLRREQMNAKFALWVTTAIAPQVSLTWDEACGRLHPRDVDVFISFFGLNGHSHETLTDIGARLGITRERARQLRNRAIHVFGFSAEIIRTMPCRNLQTTEHGRRGRHAEAAA